jgi:hypothetical protein
MPLLSLPLEIQHQIASNVETSHRPSIYAFSLTNKACHAASTPVIFRDITITVDDPEGLRHTSAAITHALSRTDSSHHVRRISIKGALRPSAAPPDRREDDHRSWWESYGLDEILSGDHEREDYSGRYVIYGSGVIEPGSTEDLAWYPVVNLLETIPHLQDVVYDCKTQFPPCLLAALHTRHPHCRLHHLSFRFRALAWGVPRPHEMALATSPCLYRVKVSCCFRNTEGEDDFNMEAAMELAAGLAPNLREVEIASLRPALSNRYKRRREPWRGLPGYAGGLTLGCLTALSIRGLSDLESPAMLRSWAEHTDFSLLRHLTLGGSYEWKTHGMTAETMEWVARNCAFTNVRTLDVYMQRDDTYRETPQYSSHAVSFFQALSPLEELSVTAPLDARILDAILARHGPTLKKLSLHPFEEVHHVVGARDIRAMPLKFTKDRLLQIQAQCPAVEELALPITRDKSRAREVEMYTCFAQMKNLRWLFLTLNCANWRLGRDGTYNPQFNGHDDEVIDPDQPYLKRGVVKDTLINCAVDETLARAIWDAVGRNKAGKQLTRLKLQTSGGGEHGGGFFPSWVADISRNLSRSWLIQPCPRHDEKGVIVKELGKRAREVDDAKMRNRQFMEPSEVFEEIWPRKEGSESWQDDWSSFPLPV